MGVPLAAVQWGGGTTAGARGSMTPCQHRSSSSLLCFPSHSSKLNLRGSLKSVKPTSESIGDTKGHSWSMDERCGGVDLSCMNEKQAGLSDHISNQKFTCKGYRNRCRHNPSLYGRWSCLRAKDAEQIIAFTIWSGRARIMTRKTSC